MEIIQLDYHRNGVSGEGFYTGILKDEDSSRKVFTHFPEYDKEGFVIKGDNVRTAILDLDILKDKEDTRFFHNSWRGDYYHDFIVESIQNKLSNDGINIVESV